MFGEKTEVGAGRVCAQCRVVTPWERLYVQQLASRATGSLLALVESLQRWAPVRRQQACAGADCV